MSTKRKRWALDDENRLWLGIVASVIVSVVLTVVLVAFVVNPAPPRSITMATGSIGGLYDSAGEALAARLADEGVTLERIATDGSVENLGRLQEASDSAEAVELAVLQGGVGLDGGAMGDATGDASADSALASLGTVFFEPLWVFHTNGREVRDLRDLQGLRVAAGAAGSGTRALLLTLLAENGITAQDLTLTAQSGQGAADALLTGSVEAAVFVTGPDRPYVRQLLSAPQIEILSFERADAYARRHGYLSAITLPRGVVDLEADVPARDVRLIASAASLVVREDVHPALQSLLLQAMRESFAEANLLAPASAFPNPHLTGFPLTPQAERYYERGGPTALRRYLPFWAANLFERLWVLAIPALTLLYPLGKTAPPVYRWRIRSRIVRWYRDLRRLEEQGRASTDPAERAAVRAELHRILMEAARIDVPLPYTDDVYRLRSHIRFVDQLVAEGPEAEWKHDANQAVSA